MSIKDSKKDTPTAGPRRTAVKNDKGNDFDDLASWAEQCIQARKRDDKGNDFDDLVSWLCEEDKMGNESTHETSSAPASASSETEDTHEWDDMSIAYRVLENKILFDEEFIEEQKKKLDGLRFSSVSSSNFHEMPEENLKVAVVGSFSCGKSTFINSILNDNVAPSEITPMTHGITSFIYGEKELYKADNEIISREEYQAKVQDKEGTVKHFIIEYPCPQLKEFEFMDSPGFASVSSNDNKTATEDTELSEEAVQRADVVFFLNNITDGTISGDAMERLKAISRNDAAANPHRRIFVILTWADRKPPKARENIRTNIINLCVDNKLAVDGVMLYSSLIDKAMKSDRLFFEDAKKQLFATLVKLRAEGQDLKKYRTELKQQAESHAKKQILSQFVKACKLFLEFQEDILLKNVEKKIDTDWSDFLNKCVRKIADYTFGKVKRTLDDTYAVSTEKLSDHWFSDYYITCNYNMFFLTSDESDKIKEVIFENKGPKLIFPQNNPAFNRFFNPVNSTDDDSVNYKTLQEYICKEILIPMYPAGVSFSTEEEAWSAAKKFVSDIRKSFRKKSVELWKEYLTAVLKTSVCEATLKPCQEEIARQVNNANDLLDQLSVSEIKTGRLNLDSTLTDCDVFSALGLSND